MAELIENMRNSAAFGAEFKPARDEVDLTKRPFKITAGGNFRVAFGDRGWARPRAAGLPGEKELIGRGLSTCATWTAISSGQAAAVVGGGDSAMEEANFLSRYASRCI